MSASVREVHARLMSAALDPADIATLAFSGVLPRFPLLGLDRATLRRLVRRYFPGLGDGPDFDARSDIALPAPDSAAVCTALSAQEFADLHTLLSEHALDDSEEAGWLACAIASACAGQNHLWEDMGLPDRETLSRLMRRHFPTLYYRNTGNLRWKKFFYKELCDRAAARICKAPSCGVCCDYAQCFGAE